MRSVSEIISQVRLLGINLRVEQGKLKAHVPDTVQQPELIAEIKERREEVIQWLRDETWDANRANQMLAAMYGEAVADWLAIIKPKGECHCRKCVSERVESDEMQTLLRLAQQAAGYTSPINVAFKSRDMHDLEQGMLEFRKTVEPIREKAAEVLRRPARAPENELRTLA
jgi:hypothetical protein